jgi:biotin synthase-like enzyme
LCRAYVVEQFESAETNAIFVCGMQPFDADDLMHGVIVTREGLECHHPVEFEYYSNPKATASWFDKELCAYCAGSSGAKGFVEEHLTIEWKSVLPICKDCRADGASHASRSD